MAAFLLIAAIPSAALGHTNSPLHYNADCDTGNPGDQGQYYVKQGQDDGSSYFRGVRATVTIPVLRACVGASAAWGGYSLINAVNALRFTGNGAFAQMGIAQQACYPGYCDDAFVNLVPDFWFTKDDWTGGVIHTATWVDALDGDTSDHDYPINGDKYQFSILETSVSGVPKWQYCVKVIASSFFGVGNNDCHKEDRTSDDGFDKAWWSAEVYNFASAIGRASGSPDSFDFKPIEYMGINGIWQTVTAQLPCLWDSQTGDPKPAAYLCISVGHPTGSIVTFYTSEHQ